MVDGVSGTFSVSKVDAAAATAMNVLAAVGFERLMTVVAMKGGLARRS